MLLINATGQPMAGVLILSAVDPEPSRRKSGNIENFAPNSGFLSIFLFFESCAHVVYFKVLIFQN